MGVEQQPESSEQKFEMPEGKRFAIRSKGGTIEFFETQEELNEFVASENER